MPTSDLSGRTFTKRSHRPWKTNLLEKTIQNIIKIIQK